MSIETTSAETLAPLAYSVSEACKVSSFGRTYLYQLIGEGSLNPLRIAERAYSLFVTGHENCAISAIFKYD